MKRTAFHTLRPINNSYILKEYQYYISPEVKKDVETNRNIKQNILALQYTFPGYFPTDQYRLIEKVVRIPLFKAVPLLKQHWFSNEMSSAKLRQKVTNLYYGNFCIGAHYIEIKNKSLL